MSNDLVHMTENDIKQFPPLRVASEYAACVAKLGGSCVMDTAWKDGKPYYTALLIFMPKLSEEHTAIAQQGVTASLTAETEPAPIRTDVPAATAILMLDHRADTHTEADLEICDLAYKDVLTNAFETLINFIPPLPHTEPSIN